MTRITLVALLASVTTAHAAPQIPEAMRGTWCNWNPLSDRSQASYIEGHCVEQKPSTPPICQDVEERDEAGAIRRRNVCVRTEEMETPKGVEMEVTPSGFDTNNARCTAIKITKLNIYARGKYGINPWGPGYRIKFKCVGEDRRTNITEQDWRIEKGYLLTDLAKQGRR